MSSCIWCWDFLNDCLVCHYTRWVVAGGLWHFHWLNHKALSSASGCLSHAWIGFQVPSLWFALGVKVIEITLPCYGLFTLVIQDDVSLDSFVCLTLVIYFQADLWTRSFNLTCVTDFCAVWVVIIVFLSLHAIMLELGKPGLDVQELDAELTRDACYQILCT